MSDLRIIGSTPDVYNPKLKLKHYTEVELQSSHWETSFTLKLGQIVRVSFCNGTGGFLINRLYTPNNIAYGELYMKGTRLYGVNGNPTEISWGRNNLTAESCSYIHFTNPLDFDFSTQQKLEELNEHLDVHSIEYLKNNRTYKQG